MSLDVLATGYPSMDYILPVSHSPTVGETALLREVPDDSAASFGGCGANVGVALVNLGFKVGLAMLLGDDYVGMLYRSRLREQRIDDKDIIVVPKTQTSRSYLYRNPDGEYQNFFFAGAADQWKGTLRLNNLLRCRYALVTVGPYHYNNQFVQLVRDAKVALVWQLKPDIFAYPQEAVRTFAAASTFILMNKFEADFVAKALGHTSPAELINETTRAVIVTTGETGSKVYTADGEQAVTAVPANRIVDTTGAGDAFTAGFLAGVLKSYDMKVSAQIGSTMASFILEQIGCQTNLPTWNRMLERYKSVFGDL